jgi:hypothetical protein
MKVLLKAAAAIAAVWLVVALEARADDCRWVSATLASKHLGASSSKHYNERNYGLGGENCLGTVLGVPLRGAAGFFRNSNRIDSLYVGGSATLVKVGPASAGFAAMLVSGYEVEPVKAVFPVVAIEGEKLGANFSYFPRTKSNGAALGMQLKWRFR